MTIETPRAEMSHATRSNLQDALRGEAFAYARYRFFAQRARVRGRDDVARLFEAAAAVELDEHFAELAELYGLDRGEDANLAGARDAEDFEVETLYASFADKARAAGEEELADRYEEIRREELAHRAAFAAALVHAEPERGRGR